MKNQLLLLKKIKSFFCYPVIFICSILIYLGLTFTSPFSSHHFLLNLEPYPDGLFYVNSAFTFLRTHHFVVTYQDYVLPAQIVPLYAGILALFYFFYSSPAVFYLANVTLGVGTITFLFLTLRLLTKRRIFTILGLVLYLSYAIIFWLPSVPMAENAVLFVFAATLFFFFSLSKKLKLLNLILLVIGIGCLVVTKFTLIPIAGIFTLAVLYLLFINKKFLWFWTTIGVFLSTGTVFIFIFQKQLSTALTIALNSELASQLIGKSAYSLSYVLSNCHYYRSE